jgi:hypothetical protein
LLSKTNPSIHDLISVAEVQTFAFALHYSHFEVPSVVVKKYPVLHADTDLSVNSL